VTTPSLHSSSDASPRPTTAKWAPSVGTWIFDSPDSRLVQTPVECMHSVHMLLLVAQQGHVEDTQDSRLLFLAAIFSANCSTRAAGGFRVPAVPLETFCFLALLALVSSRVTVSPYDLRFRSINCPSRSSRTSGRRLRSLHPQPVRCTWDRWARGTAAAGARKYTTKH
jgi:hypothetical protein